MREPQRNSPIGIATTMEGNDNRLPGGNPTYPVTPDDGATHQLMAQYLERRRAQVGQLTAALDNADYELIRRIGHNLHGSGAAYGLPRISALGEALEQDAERRDSLAVSETISQLQDFLASVVLSEPRT